MEAVVADKNNYTNKEPERGISGSTLKLIAMGAMLTDHIAATVLEDYIKIINTTDAAGNDSEQGWIILYYVMRLIGRIAFPIFAFLLVEGYVHTGSKWKYLLRLTVFAFISEIPFDIAFNIEKSEVLSGKLIELSYQNVFFTLAAGLLVIMIVDKLRSIEINRYAVWGLSLPVLAAGAFIAYAMHTDYAAYGVIAIFMIYLFRKKPEIGIMAGGVVLIMSTLFEITAIFACIPAAKYNGKRGLNLKWIFYVFYPFHLALLWIIALSLKI